MTWQKLREHFNETNRESFIDMLKNRALVTEKEVASGYGDIYYQRSMQQHAKSITDYVKKIETKSYGW